jgi:four helix bundle protein
MSPGEPGKRGFEDLEVYKIALDIIVNSEELAKNLPNTENYALASQIRKSSKAIAANIAEGYGCYHYLDSLRFYSNARGELNETLAHFISSSVLSYIGQDFFENNYKLIQQAEKALNGFMNYIRKKRDGSDLFLLQSSLSVNPCT